MAIRHVKPFRANNAAPLTSNFQKSLPKRTSSVMAILSKRAISLDDCDACEIRFLHRTSFNLHEIPCNFRPWNDVTSCVGEGIEKPSSTLLEVAPIISYLSQWECIEFETVEYSPPGRILSRYRRNPKLGEGKAAQDCILH